ncbi:hypothetical protein ACH4UM_13920 [Streptomyces sp. NPDC020801]|uniref:hypothetical protein n=1 Tax=unclassified Streptomyces TaxID=2593676 RepID=UPI0037BD6F81
MCADPLACASPTAGLAVRAAVTGVRAAVAGEVGAGAAVAAVFAVEGGPAPRAARASPVAGFPAAPVTAPPAWRGTAAPRGGLPGGGLSAPPVRRSAEFLMAPYPAVVT